VLFEPISTSLHVCLSTALPCILSPVVYVILSLLYSIFCFRLSFYIKGEQANFFVSPQITHPQILGLIPQLQIRKFLRCESLQIANPQICLESKSANRKSVNLLGQKQCLIQILIGLPLRYFLYPRKNILDQEMPCNSVSKLKQKVILKFE
jgi:hypothetical protein